MPHTPFMIWNFFPLFFGSSNTKPPIGIFGVPEIRFGVFIIIDPGGGDVGA